MFICLKNVKNVKLGVMANSYNRACFGDSGRRIVSLKPAWVTQKELLFKKTNNLHPYTRNREMTQWIENLLCPGEFRLQYMR